MIRGQDYLRLAQTLVSGATEAEWRSAVSRAYYATFHVARSLLLQCGFTVPRGEQAHGYLWLRLANAGHPDVQTAGADLQMLRRNRNRADYDFDRPFDQPNAVVQAQVAEEVVRALTAAETEPLKTQITDTMKIYERDVLKDVTWHP